MKKETKFINLKQDFCRHRIVSAVERVEFTSDRMSYIVPRGRWCYIIIFNVHEKARRKVMIQKADL